MILAIATEGTRELDAFHAVAKRLEQLGKKAVLFKQDRCLDGEYMTLTADDDGVQFILDIDGESYPLTAFDTVWYMHPFVAPALLGFQPERYRHLITRQFAGMRKGLWHLMRHATWINDPWKTEAAESKIMQLDVAQRAGLRIPPTLITSDPQRVREFWHHFNGKVIVKQLNITPLWQEAMWTERVSQADIAKIDSVRMSPAIFQMEVPKLYELRVAMFGNEVFSLKLDSQHDPETAVDWRRKPASGERAVTMEPAPTPARLRRQLRSVLDSLGLFYGAFDLIYTPSGEYVFLEVNPNGQWYFMQLETGLPIADTVARILAGRTLPAVPAIR